jgi:hypothetical protein
MQYAPNQIAPVESHEAALSALLRGRSVYMAESAGNNVKCFGSGPVSLPTSLKGAPQLMDVLPLEDHHYLLHYTERMLLPDPSADGPVPYFDPVLRRNRRRLCKFVKELNTLGLFKPVIQRKSHVGLFFVAKKNGSLRLIIDARPTNALFQKPPGAPLCSAETLASIEVVLDADCQTFGDVACTDHGDLFLGVSDVENAFHRIGIPDWLSEYFVIDVTFYAFELGLAGTTLGDRVVDPSDEVAIACTALPMGFGWAVYLCQKINEGKLGDHLTNYDSKLFNDHVGPPRIDPRCDECLHYYIYVDNLGVIGWHRPRSYYIYV